ncbi:MAG TPA: YciI family protein [Verrucomicrobiae bacterium]|jgi:hypothetical protein
MKYLCLMYLDENAATDVPREMIEKGIAECRAFFDWLAKNGHLIAHNLLHPTRYAKTVRVRDGKRLATDGPFAETKEHLIGYFLVEAGNLDEAIDLAARFPGAQWGCVEVRPVQAPA